MSTHTNPSSSSSTSDAASGFLAKTNVSGVPEFLPHGAIRFEDMIEKLRGVFRAHGAVPLQTGAFERLSTLRRKAGTTGKEIYTVGRANAPRDHEGGGGPDAEGDDGALALRFDQTVPMARFIAMNHEQLAFPFSRYAIGPVWRGERAQRGRYREFVQADLDVVGRDQLPLVCDAEAIVALVASLEAIGAPRFEVGINNRKVLEEMMLAGGVRAEHVVAVLHEFDALPKPHVGIEKAVMAMTQAGCPADHARRLCDFAMARHSDEQTFAFIAELGQQHQALLEAGEELRRVVELVRVLGVSTNVARVDLSVVRALDYYTGSIFEAKLADYPAEGAIAAGGRYDNLVSDLAADNTKLRHSFQGVGFSVGVTRLFVVLARLGLLHDLAGNEHRRRVLVLCRSDDDLERNLALVARLRRRQVAAMAYQLPKEFHQQLTYARRNGFTHLVTVSVDGEGAHRLELQDVDNPAATRRSVIEDTLFG